MINDANQTIWNRFGVNSWPTLVLIDAKGNPVDAFSGEGNYDVLDRTIGQLVEGHRARGELNLTPFKFNPEMERPSDGPLLFPGKVLADSIGKRLFIADTGHNRIIQTNFDGAEPVKIGSGVEGFDDGESDKATFNRPQGMCLEGETLYVADTENHAILRDRSQRPFGDYDRGHGQPGPRHSPPGCFRSGQDDSALQPLGRDPACRRQGNLHRDGRSTSDLEARPRL